MEHICFFNSTKAWGGGEKWHFDMAVRLHEQGCKIFFVADKKSELSVRLKDSGIHFNVCSIGKLSFLNIFLIYRLRKLFQKEQVSTVILNQSIDLKVAGIAARWAGVKRIIYRRGSAIPIKNQLYNRFLFRHIITDVIANSEATRRTIVQNNSRLFDVQKIRVIYNGIDFQNYPPVPITTCYERQGSEIILGNAGRMVYQKGQEFLIEVAARLKDAGIDFKLLIAGSGPLEQQLRKQVLIKGLENNLIFTGFSESIGSFMQNIDIFLLSSRWEGFGFVLAEAMAARKPIVAFDISSNPELVCNGINGYLVSPFDVDDFFTKTRELIQSKETRDRFGEKGLQMAHEKFDIKRAVNELKQVLNI